MDVIEISVLDYFDTEFIMLARNEKELEMIKQDIDEYGGVHIHNVLVVKDGEVTGYIEDAHIMLAFLKSETLQSRVCKDDQPKFALL